MNIKGLKICFIAGTLGVGGAERQLYIILSTLKKLGASISLISLTNGEYWEQPIKDLGIDYNTLKGRGNKATRLLKIITLLIKIKPAIVQSQHFYTNLYAGIASKFCGAISIGSSRSELRVEIMLNGFFGPVCYKVPKYIIANSQKSVKQAIVLGKKASRVFYLTNALDLQKFSPGNKAKSDKDNITLLAIGSLISLKRFDIFIDLVARLRLIYGERIKGQLIGNGVLGEQLRQLAINAGMQQDAFEFVSNTHAPETYMRDADFLIICSEYEGTPNVAIEAMASGLPVISTKVGNLPYFIKDGENGFFYDHSVEQLTEILTDLINNKEKAAVVSANARKTAEELFSTEALEKNLVLIYEQITRY
jgi:glycosyltransferase involved in cell wall biosynthesis